jgi:hypothetical protein
MDVTEHPSHLAVSAAALILSLTENFKSDSAVPSLPPGRENSIISSGESAANSDPGYNWDPENPENQMGLYENGGIWGPGWEDRFYIAQKVCWKAICFIKQVINNIQHISDDGGGGLEEFTLGRKHPREASTPDYSRSDEEKEPGPAQAKRARTDVYRQLSDFETKFISLLEVDARRRALHEEKMEQLTFNVLEEVQATRQSLVRYFTKRDSDWLYIYFYPCCH